MSDLRDAAINMQIWSLWSTGDLWGQLNDPKVGICFLAHCSAKSGESFIFLKKVACHWQRSKVAAFCDRAEVYLWRHRTVTSPDLNLKKYWYPAWLEVSHTKFQHSTANGSGAIARNRSGGWHPLPRPVKVKFHKCLPHQENYCLLSIVVTLFANMKLIGIYIQR